MRKVQTAVLLAVATGMHAAAQDCAARTARITGEVRDRSGALVVDAGVLIDGAESLHSDRQGRYTTSCVADGEHTLQIQMDGFEPLELRAVAQTGGHIAVATLKPLTVTAVVNAVSATGLDSDDVAGTKTLQADDLKQMADDPDEFARQLQVLAAAAGGAPGQAIIAVDGFQNSGSIPPKSAIAFIRVNPDLFAAEYERPPYEGGRVEIYTKPGQSKLHGALFTTLSGQFMNAQDPFSPAAPPSVSSVTASS